MTSQSRVPILLLATLLAAALPAGAAQASAQGAVSVGAGGAAQAPAPAPAPAATPEPAPAATPAPEPAAMPLARRTRWIDRYRPVRNSWELGIYGGAFIPSKRHEFYAPKLDQPGLGHQPLARAGLDIGLRVGYYPLSFLGLELEGGVMPMAAECARG